MYCDPVVNAPVSPDYTKPRWPQPFARHNEAGTDVVVRPLAYRTVQQAASTQPPPRPRARQLDEPNVRDNQLLAALPDHALQRLVSRLEPITMPLGMVLGESGGPIRHVYFPTSAVVSVLCTLSDGACAEIAVVGNDGLVGIALLMGSVSSPNHSVVQTAGFGFRLEASVLKAEFDRPGPVLSLLLRYTQALITQTLQTAVCNRHHCLEQQLCRRLLLSLDRQAGNEIVITQERLAQMLGVRREGVTVAALRLQHAGLISYTRGRIRVLDRRALQHRSCECYAVVKKEYDRLLPGRSAESSGWARPQPNFDRPTERPGSMSSAPRPSWPPSSALRVAGQVSPTRLTTQSM